MASGASSGTIVDSTAANLRSYDVFLSFRGQDTRHSFTDHLFDALRRAGIGTFRDDEEINRGEELKPEIERAIQNSKASIVVLSENYATSTWCLDELLLILQQRRECNHFVLPVFYHVDPSDVRKQDKTFAIEVKACSRWTDQNVNLWTKALMEVADLAGMVVSGPETEFLTEITDTIYNKLDRKEVHLPINLIGMVTRYEDINSWLNGSDVEFLVICGMGGSGKTTLAKYIVYSNWQNFESISIVEDIGSRCKDPHDMIQLQEKLFGDISCGKKRKIPSVCQGTSKIEEVLQVKKALIVLDDIVSPIQLVALLGSGHINKQSKIVITTREINTGKWFESRSWRCQEYQMKLLDDEESLELLSRHAFGSKNLLEGYEELAKQVLTYCDGNPLALEVLGSSLAVDNSILYWESTLRLLERDIDVGIQRVLVRSFNSLPHDSIKELFLHISCFFVGKDIDYVVKILEHDYSAVFGIKTLTNRCLLSVSPNKKLMMHPLLQEMGRTIVYQESPKHPAKRSRVWHNKDSYDVLKKGKGSEKTEGLALDMRILKKENYTFKASNLKTDALEKMDKLKLLQLNFVELSGSYGNVSENLRWLCLIGFHSRSIPSDLFMGNLVAIDMSYSKLDVFEPPTVLQSLKILNLKDSYNLLEIRNISRIPHLETLILWNCHSLAHVCETIGDLTCLALLNMTGCENVCKWEKTNPIIGLEASTSGGVAKQPTFSFPHSLHQLFLKDCNLECTESFPLSFSVQISLQYLNLGNSLFEFLPCYDHLKSLRVLDLSLCARLKWLLCLPNTLAELYIYYCKSLEKISFQSHRFTLQEFGYEGCVSLTEIEGFIKLVPVAKLEENDLGHMKWLKEYQNLEVCLVGDDELTIGRSWCIQILYEFNITSTSLPDIKDPSMQPKYVSELSSLSFDVPPCPKNRRLKGLDVTFKYTLSGDDYWAWFCKISTKNGVDLMYNPKVFGKPDFGKVGIWLSYWPIGNTLNTGDEVNVSVVVISGLEVHECGVSLVYTDDTEAEEALENNNGWVETLGGDLSRFQLSTGAYYLCRRDFFELMEVGRVTPDWFRILVGDTIDCTEVRGWRKTGRPKQMNPSFTELKVVRCIIHGPQSEEIYQVAEMSKSSFVDKTSEFTSNLLGTMKFASTSKFSDAAIKTEEKSEAASSQEIFKSYRLRLRTDAIAQLAQRLAQQKKDREKELNEIHNPKGIDRSKALLPDEVQESTLSPSGEKPKSSPPGEVSRPVKESLDIEFVTEYGEGSRYKLVEVIGKGSSGIVYSAIDTHNGDKVAIKKIKDIFTHVSDATSVLREIKLLRLLRHPDIVEIKNILLPPSRRNFKHVYVVFELMDSDLHQVIKVNDDLVPEHHRFFLYQLLRGLKYVHTANVMHRDLKPKNILANANCKLKICDFGLSRVAFSDQPTTIFWTDYVGARWYRAPELCGSFFSKYTPAIDIWSIGCIFAEVLMGKPLFPGKSVVHQLDLMTDLLGTPSLETISMIKNEKARKYLTSMRKKEPVPFTLKFPNADPLALRLLKKMIAFDPKDRPTVLEALSDPYFKNLASVNREPSAQSIPRSEFEFERRRLTKEDVRELIYREILEFHPSMLKEYLDEAESTNIMNPSSKKLGIKK